MASPTKNSTANVSEWNDRMRSSRWKRLSPGTMPGRTVNGKQGVKLSPRMVNRPGSRNHRDWRCGRTPAAAGTESVRYDVQTNTPFPERVRSYPFRVHPRPAPS